MTSNANSFTNLSTRWRASAPIAILTLLFNNLVPLLGVLYLGWELYSIILVYWVENGVIGLFNIIKMALAKGHPASTAKEEALAERIGQQNMERIRRARRYFLPPFFLVHYGFFWFVHGIFVQTFFGSVFGLSADPTMPPTLLPEGALGALGAMIISHGSSFARNYVGQGEYLVATPQQLMTQPYRRVFILQITIIGGGFLVMQLGEPLYGLLLLIGLKTSVDLWSHLREHWRYRAAL